MCIANVAGVPDDAIRAMSTRREQVLNLAAELGTNSPHGRQAAALATRAAKDISVDPAELRRQWHTRLADAGFGPDQLAAATTATPTRAWTDDDTRRMYAHLAGPLGVTEQQAIFDRRNTERLVVASQFRCQVSIVSRRYRSRSTEMG